MNLAFIDLETTGTDETAGSILEIGLTVTDMELNVLHRWETLVIPDIVHVATMDPVVREMHAASGLSDELDALSGEREAGRRHDGLLNLDTADLRLALCLNEHKRRGQVVLAGSGVAHFDSRWIRAHLPLSAALLTYWTIDVGVVRRFLSMIVGAELPEPPTTKPHRGQADVRLHLAETVAYRDAIRAVLADVNRALERRPTQQQNTKGLTDV